MKNFTSCRAGEGPCPTCDKTIVYKVNKKGHLYAYCDTPADGGCGCGSTSRTDAGDQRFAKKIVKWASPEIRKHFIDGAAPEPEPEEPEDEEFEEEPEPEEPEDEEPEEPPASKPKKPPVAPPKKPAPKPKRRRAVVNDDDDDDFKILI